MRARAGAWGVVAASVSLVGTVHAQIVTDGSLGPATALTGDIIAIDSALGQTRGANLFHSFSAFNVGSQQAAFFLGTPGLVNIIARVTGNSPSTIDGFLGAPANLYLLNPRGILFGAGAELNVSGSLHATTADYLRFSNGQRFEASLSGTTSLSVAPPVAFGFADGVAGPISTSGSILVGPAGSALTFIGGDVTLDNTLVSLEHGTIAAIGVRSAGEVVMSNGSFDTSSFTAMGDVSLHTSQINVFDEEGTSVYIRGGRFVMEELSFIGAVSTQPAPARVVELDIDVDSLQLANSAIASASTDDGLGVPIRIKADEITLGQTAAVTAAAAGSRVGGDIDVQTGSLTIHGDETLAGGFSVFGTAALSGTGGAGNLTVHASTIDITGGGLSAITASPGSGGDVTLVADRVTLHAAGTITAGTNGIGNGGRVSITAREVTLDAGTSVALPTITVMTTAPRSDAGDAGTIEIHADDLRLSNGHIVSSTAGPGSGGAIDITAQRAVLEQGASIASDTGIPSIFGPAATYGSGGTIRFETDSLQVLSGSRISAIAASNGAGGNIDIDAATLQIHNATVNTNSVGSGNAGRIDVAGGSATVGAGASITASSLGQDADAGDANDIAIDVAELTVSDGGRVANATQGSGAAGDIVVNAQRVTLRDGGSISAATSGAGNGGRIAVSAGELLAEADDLSAGPVISVAASATGNAGAIEIDVDALRLHGTQISSSTVAAGNGGTIGIDARDLVLEQGGSISADTLGTGTGGTIAIDAGRLAIDGAGSGISANTGSIQDTATSGAGGNVLISAETLTLRNRAAISANTFGTGDAGRITIDGGVVNVAAGAAISAASFGQAADAGDANDISIAARAVSLSDTGQVTTATHGAGSAGRLQVQSDELSIASGGLLQSSSLSLGADAGAVGEVFIDSDRVLIDNGSINARSAGGGRPASIAIRSGSMLMTNGAVISAVSTGSADAGNIGIAALDTLELRGFSRITTEAELAAGGNIALIVGNRLLMTDSTISTSVLGGTANGGNILIDPILVLLDNSSIVARAIGGNGGAIDIATQFLLRSAGSVIDASSELGIAGRIGILGFDADLNADIAPLPADFLDAQQWLAQPCINRLGTDVSRFTVAGRDGAYRSPLDFMPSPLAFDASDTASRPVARVLDTASFTSLLAGIRCH